MKRLRLATLAAAAGLTLIAGCQSCGSNCCSGCCGERPGLLTRLGLRPRTAVIYEGGVGGAPVVDGPIDGGFPVGGFPPAGGCPCSTVGGGPILGGPPVIMTVPGGAMPPAMP